MPKRLRPIATYSIDPAATGMLRALALATGEPASRIAEAGMLREAAYRLERLTADERARYDAALASTTGTPAP